MMGVFDISSLQFSAEKLPLWSHSWFKAVSLIQCLDWTLSRCFMLVGLTSLDLLKEGNFLLCQSPKHLDFDSADEGRDGTQQQASSAACTDGAGEPNTRKAMGNLNWPSGDTSVDAG